MVNTPRELYMMKVSLSALMIGTQQILTLTSVSYAICMTEEGYGLWVREYHKNNSFIKLKGELF
jgi:hypothetical protein